MDQNILGGMWQKAQQEFAQSYGINAPAQPAQRGIANNSAYPIKKPNAMASGNAASAGISPSFGSQVT
jgi:hypothetical protein